MLKKYEIMIAFRYLKSKRKEGFISVVSAFSFLGIALGVATLIIVMAVMNGYEIELVNRILGINGHVTISSSTGKVTNYEKIIKNVKTISNVEYTAPMILEQAMATTPSRSSGVMVRGMAPHDLEHKPLLSSSIRVGSFEKFKEGKGVLIGISLARQLRVSVGDSIKLITSSADATILGSIPRMKTMPIVGIFDVGMYEYNATTVFMPLEFAQKFFQYGKSVSDIEVIVDKVNAINMVKSEIAAKLDEPMNITDWSRANENIISALRVEKNVMFLILTLIILVAAFNIISSLIMLVKEKTKNIAILRTVGMSQASVVRIFMLSGSVIGIVGTFLGCILGVLFSLNIENIREFLQSAMGVTLFDPVIYFLTELPAELEISSVFTIMAMSLTLSLLATIYPAWKASKLMPAEALRYE